MKLHPTVEAMLPFVTKARRDLHRIPEPGYEEQKTQAYILETLKAFAPDLLQTIAETGVKAATTCSSHQGISARDTWH